MRRDRAVIVFARVPRLGEVKSRIAARAGAEVALSVHRALLDVAVTTVAGLEGVIGELCVTGVDSSGECASLAARHGLELTLQTGDDLGERMYHALERHTRGGRRAVLIGADCPWLKPDDLQHAFALLQSHEQVFAPALDGGYVLVGSRQARRSLFEGVVWGSDRVMSQTRERLDKQAIRAAIMQPFRDVDEWDDWLAWLAERPASTDKVTHGWPS